MNLSISKLLAAAQAAVATAETASPELVAFLDQARQLGSQAGELTLELENSFQQHVTRLTGSTNGLNPVTVVAPASTTAPAPAPAQAAGTSSAPVAEADAAKNQVEADPENQPSQGEPKAAA